MRVGGRRNAFWHRSPFVVCWLLLSHHGGTQGPDTSPPWLPAARLWSDSLRSVILFYKHSREQRTAVAIRSRKPASWPSFSALTFTRNVPVLSRVCPRSSAVIKVKTVFLCVPAVYALNMSVFSLQDKSLLPISAAVCNFGGQPSDLHSEVAHLLCVCQVRETDTVSLFKIVVLIRRLLIHPYKAWVTWVPHVFGFIKIPNFYSCAGVSG